MLSSWVSTSANWRCLSWPATLAQLPAHGSRWGERRRLGAATGILVAGVDAIDQYLLAHPDYLFDQSPEHALVNPDNPVILAGHLACAAAELPFVPGEGFGTAPDVADALAFLAGAGDLYTQDGRYYWAGTVSPSAAISLRTASPDRIVIQTSGEWQQRPQALTATVRRYCAGVTLRTRKAFPARRCWARWSAPARRCCFTRGLIYFMLARAIW